MSEGEGGEIGQLRAENARRRLTGAKLKADLAAALATVAALTKERDGLRSSAPDPAASAVLATELEELRGQVRMARHKDGLAALAYSAEIGVNKAVPVDRLITISGYKAGADEFDPKAATKLLEALKVSDPYLFGEGGGGPAPGPAPAPGVRPPANESHLWRAVQNRGEARGVVPSESITREQSRDAAFVMEQAAMRRKAAAQGK